MEKPSDFLDFTEKSRAGGGIRTHMELNVPLDFESSAFRFFLIVNSLKMNKLEAFLTAPLFPCAGGVPTLPFF